MTYQIEVQIRKIWSPLKKALPSTREKACELIMAMRNNKDRVFTGIKFRIRPVTDIVNLEEL